MTKLLQSALRPGKGPRCRTSSLDRLHQAVRPLSVRKRKRRRLPFWTRPESTPLRLWKAIESQIETFDDAARYTQGNISVLGRFDRFSDRVESIERCSDDKPCGDYFCAFCAREYRLWHAHQLLQHIEEFRTAHVLTILLTVVPGPKLKSVNISKLQDRLRKRLERAGITEAIGGTEASFKADAWTVHVHLLVFDLTTQSLKALRNAYAKDGLDRAVVCQKLRDPVKQVSYLQKFATYHRPGVPGHSGKGRAYPLKPRQITQLAWWTGDLGYGDFGFVIGFRRQGSQFVRSGRSRKSIGPQRNSKLD